MKKHVVLPEDNTEKILGIFIKDSEFYKSFFSLMIVIALQQLAALTVNLLDNIMLGMYSEQALSGATLVNQLQFMLQQIVSAGGLGIVVLSSQYWGQQRTSSIKNIISIGTKFCLIVGIIFFIATTLLPEQILGFFSNDETIISEGVEYLKIMRFTYIIFAISNSLMYSMQSVETAFIGTIMSLSTICINFSLNYIFIFGNLGAPEMGIRGAAIATLTSRIVELIIITVYVFFIDKKLHIRLWDLVRLNPDYLRDFIKVSSPMIICGMMWGIAQAAQTAILGHVGTAAIGANSIASVVFQLFITFGFSCSNAASIMIGKTIGMGELEKVKPFAKTIQGIFVIMGILSFLLIFFSKDAIANLYSISEETRELTVQFMIVLAIASIGSCYEYPVMSGIIAGGGFTAYPAICDNLFMWLFTIPLAFISAFVLEMPPLVTFCCLKADQLLKCIPNAIVCNRYKWVRILTKEDTKNSESSLS